MCLFCLFVDKTNKITFSASNGTVRHKIKVMSLRSTHENSSVSQSTTYHDTKNIKQNQNIQFTFRKIRVLEAKGERSNLNALDAISTAGKFE